jgi:formylglycine-generating enzyme required for sulfatase activity
MIMELLAIPEGWFSMGWERGLPGEGPRHRVFTDPFEIGKTPVTNAEYDRFLRATRHEPPPFRDDTNFSHPDQPIVGVSWHDATGYCRWLIEEEGREYRLPREAEWERAARGGLADGVYPWGDRPPDEVFTNRALPLDRPPIVGSEPANGFGLTDLSGVVHEWCLDWYSESYYAVSPHRNPEGPPSGSRRVSRGGAWRHQNPWSPVAHRSSLPPQLRYSDYGFRVVRV